MTTIGYIRVSSDKQDLEKQKHLLWQYAQAHQLLIDEFVPVEMSSQKSQRERHKKKVISLRQSPYVVIPNQVTLRTTSATLRPLKPYNTNNASSIFVAVIDVFRL